MHIYVAPISGGFFPNQMQLLCALDPTGIRPDVCMGTSGGNMALYFALISGWTDGKIRELMAHMNHSLIVKSWAPQSLRFVPSAVWGVLKGSMFDRSEIDPFMHLVDTSLLTGTEIWTTAFNKMQHKTKYFCNLACGKTRLTYTNDYVRAGPLRYASGDYALIRAVVTASAAVPGVQREVDIDGEAHIDGGVSSASPFAAFQNNIRQLNHDQDVHVVYLSGHNVRHPTSETQATGFLAESMAAMHVLMEGSTLNDISVVINFLYTSPKFVHGRHTMRYSCTPGSATELKKCTALALQHPATVMILYPLYNRSIDYTSFCAADLLSVMDLTRDHYFIELYWFQ